MTDKTSRADIHQTVTDAIIKMLETAQATGATFPWCRPGIAHSRPTNALSTQRYRGINVLTLWATADAANYRSGIFATYRQWQELGAQVRKGERAAPIVFYKPLEITDDKTDSNDSGDATTKTIRMAKGYWVFNADQVDGFTLPELPTIDLTTRLEHVEQVVARLGIDIRHGGASAYYRPGDDTVQMPERTLFQDTPTSTATEGFYAVLMHEIGHACGAKHRLNRDLSGRFGTVSYAVEELVAEWFSAMMCAELSITAQPREDHAHYISNWLSVLKSDKGAAMSAAAQASRAAEYLMSLTTPAATEVAE
jgi:antirestriction protein ArdC